LSAGGDSCSAALACSGRVRSEREISYLDSEGWTGGKLGVRWRPLREGLRELLKPLKLDGMSPVGSQTKEKLGLAMAWCEEMGPTTVEELFELDEEDRNGFVAALKLKPTKKKALLKKLTPDTNLPPSPSAGNVALNAHV